MNTPHTLKQGATLLFVLFFALLLPLSASAHQPRIVTGTPVVVPNPEVSKAYYANLSGKPDVYTITSTTSFPLYVNVLVPKLPGVDTSLTVTIVKDKNEAEPVAVLTGSTFTWEPFFEEFGRDTYLKGPEYKAEAAPGTYEITVQSSKNDARYSLAIGEAEVFDFKETVNALTLIPKLKKDFFNESPIGFILSPFGYGLIIIMFILSFIFGFIYRALLLRFAKGTARGVGKNIGAPDRWLRAVLGVLLLLLAVLTTWNPILIFFSGFCFFEAIFSWCGFNAVIGKNSCPV